MKRALLLALAVLALAPIARAETVTAAPVDDALLALTPAGIPTAVFLRNGAVTVAARLPDGWREDAAGTVDPSLSLFGFAVGRRGPVVLLESSSRLVLLSDRAGWRSVTLKAPTGSAFGPGGLALDAAGEPVVAYTLLNRRGQSFLRLLRRRGSTVSSTAVTLRGFPPTHAPPAAAPVVLANGRVHVLEVFGGGAIEWRPSGRTWIGQFLPASSLAVPVGVAGAAAARGVVYTSWTEDFPGHGETHVVLVSRGAATILDTHAFLTALAVGPGGAEVAANDWFDSGASRTYDGLVLGGDGTRLGLDGRLEGYAIAADGTRNLLLAGRGGLSWYGVRALPRPLTLAATRSADGSVRLTGAAPGATSVALYRGNELLTTVAVGADESYAAVDPAPAGAAVYRAAATDGVSGLPLGALARP